jgi:hypothetical protein
VNGSRRIWSAVLLVVTIALGLASRRYPSMQPAFVATYAGDALWAAAVYWLLALLLPRASTTRLVAASLAIAVAVEISQLQRDPWLDALRATRPGALVFGQGFLWTDLACYVAGVCLAAIVDTRLVPRARPARP